VLTVGLITASLFIPLPDRLADSEVGLRAFQLVFLLLLIRTVSRAQSRRRQLPMRRRSGFPRTLPSDLLDILRSESVSSRGRRIPFLIDDWIVEACFLDEGPSADECLVVTLRRPDESRVRVTVDAQQFFNAHGTRRTAPYLASPHAFPADEVSVLLQETVHAVFDTSDSELHIEP
jgi:hypothetical protein